MAISIILDVPGGKPRDLVKEGWNAVRFSTVINGGFSSAAIVAPGDARKGVPLLSKLKIMNDDRVLFEARAEDLTYSWDSSSQATTIDAFGAQRLLQLASLNRLWLLRSFQFATATDYGITLLSNLLSVATGRCDPVDYTKYGVRIAGQGSSITVGGNVPTQAAHFIIPSGVTPVRLKGTFLHNGSANIVGLIASNDSAGTYTNIFGIPAGTAVSQDFDITLLAGTVRLIFAGGVASTATYAVSDYVQFSNMRLLCTTINEDASGGIYGGTLLQDILTFVPGIIPGRIDPGTEFLIQEFDYSTRAQVSAIINTIVGYYTKEWGVWEDGRFDWLQPNLNEPGWTIPLGDTISGQIKQTVDGLSRDTYVTYVDPTDQRQKEASYVTPSLKNPFVRNGLLSDDVESPGLAFTPTTAALFAQAANLKNSQIPAAQGSIVVPAWKPFPRSTGTAAPACEIRAGENVSIPDLPTDDSFAAGQDNANLFHIVQSDVDLSAGTVTLTIAGYLPSLDVLTARLNAATKVVTS